MHRYIIHLPWTSTVLLELTIESLLQSYNNIYISLSLQLASPVHLALLYKCRFLSESRLILEFIQGHLKDSLVGI